MTPPELVQKLVPVLLSAAHAHPPPDVYLSIWVSEQVVIRERPLLSTCRPVAVAPELPSLTATASEVICIPLPVCISRVSGDPAVNTRPLPARDEAMSSPVMVAST